MSRQSDQQKLLATLRRLYDLMLDAVVELRLHSDEGREHAKELTNAAVVVGQWIREIEK